jgi:cobalt-zinc-cadmium efflux system protein
MYMTHNHHHHREMSWGKRLIITMVMNLIIPVVQIVGGIVAGSMALISDALHNLSDFTATLIGYIALRIGEKGPTPRLTFGYKRIEVFAAILNVAILSDAFSEPPADPGIPGNVVCPLRICGQYDFGLNSSQRGQGKY